MPLRPGHPHADRLSTMPSVGEVRAWRARRAAAAVPAPQRPPEPLREAAKAPQGAPEAQPVLAAPGASGEAAEAPGGGQGGDAPPEGGEDPEGEGYADPESLTESLTAGERVVVSDHRGKPWAFSIQPVSPMAWDPEGAWYGKLLSEDGAAFTARISEAVSSPTESIMRGVLTRGVCKPLVSPIRVKGAVWVDDIMRDDLLSRELYAEVARLSMRTLSLKVERA